MDILKQSVGYNDAEAGTTVLVPGTVIPSDLEDKDFLDYLEDRELLERAPRGFKPDSKQAFFYDKAGATAKATSTNVVPTPDGDDNPENDADPGLFSVGAKALEEATVEDVEDMVKNMSQPELDDVLALENAGRGRKGVKAAIAKRSKELLAE